MESLIFLLVPYASPQKSLFSHSKAANLQHQTCRPLYESNRFFHIEVGEKNGILIKSRRLPNFFTAIQCHNSDTTVTLSNSKTQYITFRYTMTSNKQATENDALVPKDEEDPVLLARDFETCTNHSNHQGRRIGYCQVGYPNFHSPPVVCGNEDYRFCTTGAC